MNNKKLCLLTLAIAAFIGILGFTANTSIAGGPNNGWEFTVIEDSSGTVFNGFGRIGAIYVSSDTIGNRAVNWGVLVDTPNVTPVTNYNSFTRGQKKSIPFFFSSSMTSDTQSYWTVVADYGDSGVRISSAATIWKTAASSGEALKVGVRWTKE